MSPLRHIVTALLLIVVSAVPFLSTAQTDSQTPTETPPESTAAQYQFKNEGIFGCNQVAGANASAGTMAAIGGVYVPVNDAAVTLNTGILVYKECILRPLQNRLRESAISALFKRQYIGIETGREGGKQYVVDIDDELGIVDDRATIAYLKGPALDTVRPEYRETVRRVLAASQRADKGRTEKQGCAYVGDLNAAARNPTAEPVPLYNLAALRDPACIQFLEYIQRKDELNAARALAKANQMTMWDWGRGFYAVTDNAQDPFAEKTLTPASVVQESFQQILGSPVRQLESANDIGQMIGALFAGVTTQALTDTRGLAGFSQSIGGQPSYLEQVARESSQGVIGAAVNAALTILNASREIESRYLAAMEAIASTLTQAINQMHNTERACWDLVVPKAQAYASQTSCVTDPATGAQTCTGGFQLDPAKTSRSTSTLAFSQQIIDSQIKPLADAALANIQSSRRALGLIDQLIAGITNTASLNAQRIALQQLDMLVAERALHTKFDAENAAKQKDDVAGAMATLVQDTAKAWGDSPDPSIGWCNVNNADIPRLWAERWKK